MAIDVETRQVGRDFWRSAGYQLLRIDASGRLEVTEDFLRAYYTRPEVHPTDESCKAEHTLFDAMMAEPFRTVSPAELAALADTDVADNYRVVLDFRDHLLRHGTLEAAYHALFSGADAPPLPVAFVDQMVHAILCNILGRVGDPIRLRAAELLFREQTVSLDDSRVMLADAEIVEMYARSGGMGGLGQLLVETSTTPQVSLDVLDEDNAAIYWERSDRFDTVVDFRFTQPALDGFARVMESWVQHFLGLETRIQPMQSIKDERWSWHVGLDAESTRILNALYTGENIPSDTLEQIIGLFRMEIRDHNAVRDSMRRKPVYLGVAMTGGRRLRVKPQNLLTNLPLARQA